WPVVPTRQAAPLKNSSPKHSLDLPASELNVHRPSVWAVGLELRAIQFREQRMDFRRLEHASHSNRAMTRELLQPILERSLASTAKACIAHALDHVAEQLRAAFGSEHRGRALEQQSGRPERLDIEAHRAQLAQRAMHLRRARGIQLDRHLREHRLRAN